MIASNGGWRIRAIGPRRIRAMSSALLTLGAKFPNPATLPAGNAGLGAATQPPASPSSPTNCSAWSPDDDRYAAASNLTPFADVWNFSNGAFQAKYSVSPSLAGAGQEVTWSPNGLYLAFAHNNSPYVTVCPVS